MIDLAAIPMTRRSLPPPSSVDTPFWQGLAHGELHIQQCAACGEWIWAPQFRCGRCGSWDLAWPQVAMHGTIHAFARTCHAFAPLMRGHIPFVTVLVALPDAGGRRLLGLLVGDEAKLASGAKVTGLVQAPEKPGELAALRWRLSDHG